MAITRSQQKPQQHQQLQPESNPTPAAMINAHLLAVIPYIAGIKVNSPKVWETAYTSATDPHPDTSTTDLVHLICNTNTWLAAPDDMTPEQLADQMHKIKFAWDKFGMYAMAEYTDPNPRVKAAMASHRVSEA